MMTDRRNRWGIALMTAAALGMAVTIAATPARSDETAQATRGALNLEIITGCSNGEATFRVRNNGKSWPKSSTFAIYELDDQGGRLLSKRRLRLKDGQKASFNFKTEENPTGRLGLYVHPAWYKRKFDLDAQINCR